MARLLDGTNAADIVALLLVIWLAVRLEWIRSENTAAHDVIAKKLHGLKQGLNGVRPK